MRRAYSLRQSTRRVPLASDWPRFLKRPCDCETLIRLLFLNHMPTALIHLSNVLGVFIPSSLGFRFRRSLLRAAGLDIQPGVRFAANTRVYDRFVSVGRDTWIGMHTIVASCRQGHVSIGECVDIGPGCIIVSGTHQIGDSRRRAGQGDGAEISIGRGCWVGAGARVLAGASIGSGCVIAAGSVVCAGTYPSDSLLAGVPAQVTKRYGRTAEH